MNTKKKKKAKNDRIVLATDPQTFYEQERNHQIKHLCDFGTNLMLAHRTPTA